MDKSLEDIIATSDTRSRRGGRRGASRRTAAANARAQVLGKPVVAAAPAQRTRAAAAGPTGVKPVVNNAEKIIVSNLPYDVNEAQIKELFSQTVGPVTSLNLTYDAQGRSKGVATVVFQKKGDGTKAFQQYNNRLVDGKRAMKIEIVVDPTAPVPLASRVAPPPVENGPPKTAPAGRGRRPKGRGGARKNERPAKSAADLDAEMEDYTSSNAPAAT